MNSKSHTTERGNICYWADCASGKSAPWLVFLPGLTADHTLFDAQVRHFPGRANCLVWDAPAHGLSRPFPLDFTMDDYARWLHEILEAEGTARPILVGQSLGGYVSQAYIDLYPGEGAGFVAIDSAPLKHKYYPRWEIRALRHTKGMYQAIPRALASGHVPPPQATGCFSTAYHLAGRLAPMQSIARERRPSWL